LHSYGGGTGESDFGEEEKALKASNSFSDLQQRPK